MFGMVVAIVSFERSGVRVTGFCEVGRAIFSVGFRKGFKEFEIVGASDLVLFVTLKKICHSLKGLACSIGPRLTAPPATRFFEEEHGIISFDGARAEGGFESICLQEFFPSDLESFICIGQVELPGNIAD